MSEASQGQPKTIGERADSHRERIGDCYGLGFRVLAITLVQAIEKGRVKATKGI